MLFKHGAKLLRKLLLDINQVILAAGGVLPEAEIEVYKKQYRNILNQGEEV